MPEFNHQANPQEGILQTNQEIVQSLKKLIPGEFSDPDAQEYAKLILELSNDATREIWYCLNNFGVNDFYSLVDNASRKGTLKEALSLVRLLPQQTKLANIQNIAAQMVKLAK